MFDAGSAIQFDRLLRETLDAAAAAASDDAKWRDLYRAVDTYAANARLKGSDPDVMAAMDDLDEAFRSVRRECRIAGVTVSTRTTPVVVDDPDAAYDHEEPEPQYVGPDAAAVRQYVRSLYGEYLKRRPGDDELAMLVRDFYIVDEGAWAQGGDTDARFREHFISVYRNEINAREDAEESARQREATRRMFRCMDDEMAGRPRPDYC